MPTADAILRHLARSHGYTVFAEDGPVGSVATPLFPPNSDAPDYFVVQARSPAGRRPVISASLVEHVDPQRQIVYVRASGREIDRLPEHLPLAVGHSDP